jgi:hypothetical protein
MPFGPDGTWSMFDADMDRALLEGEQDYAAERALEEHLQSRKIDLRQLRMRQQRKGSRVWVFSRWILLTGYASQSLSSGWVVGTGHFGSREDWGIVAFGDGVALAEAVAAVRRAVG